MQALIAAVLPMLVSALSSVLGKSVSEFNALPRSERPAKLRAVLRSKWMLTSPPAAIAARALAATDAGVNAAVNALEKYGSGAVALGTEAAHAAAEKHLAKNPRSGGRMARVRIAPSIPTYALDRLDVTRARRNGYSRRRNCGGDCACAPCQAAARSNPDPFAAVRRATEKKVLRYVEEGSSVKGTWGQLVDAAYRVYEKHRIATGEQLPVEAVVAEINAARTRAEGLRSAHNKRAAHAAEQAYRDEMRGRSAYMNPLTVVGGAGPFPEGMVVEHPGVKPMARLKAAINRIDIARTSSEAHRAYGQAHRVYESLKRAGVYIHPSLFSDIGFSYTDKLRSIPLTPEEELEAEKARLYPPRKRGARRNHHIRVGGTFYTPGGRRGTVLAEARGGYYRVRWSDGTVGTVQDNEWAAYPTEGSRARTNGKSDYYAIVVDMAGNEHMVGPMDMRAAQDRVRALESKGMPDGYGGLRPLKRGAGHIRSAQAVMSSALLKYRNPGTGTKGAKKAEGPYMFVEWKALDGSYRGSNYRKSQLPALFDQLRTAGVLRVTLDETTDIDLTPARSNGTETKYYGYRLYFGKPTQNKWAGDFATREQAQEKADEMIGEYGEPSDGIRIVKYRAQLRRK